MYVKLTPEFVGFGVSGIPQTPKETTKPLNPKP